MAFIDSIFSKYFYYMLKTTKHLIIISLQMSRVCYLINRITKYKANFFTAQVLNKMDLQRSPFMSNPRLFRYRLVSS